MGNFQSGCDLRDQEVEKRIPGNISQISTNLILALLDGIYYPCVILGRATTILDGYRVYVFHFKEETEIPGTNIIGNLRALLHCEVNFSDENGRTCTGIVRSTDYRSQESSQPMNFFVCESNTRVCSWVSLPFIHLTKEQARVLFC